MLELLAQWAPGWHGPLVGHSFRHLSSFIVSDSLGILPHSEAIASVPLVTSWDRWSHPGHHLGQLLPSHPHRLGPVVL